VTDLERARARDIRRGSALVERCFDVQSLALQAATEARQGIELNLADTLASHAHFRTDLLQCRAAMPVQAANRVAIPMVAMVMGMLFSAHN